MLTQSQFARKAGVARQAVNQKIKKGLIITTEDEKGRLRIDLENPVNKAYVESTSRQRLKSQEEVGGIRPKEQVKKPEKGGNQRETAKRDHAIADIIRRKTNVDLAIREETLATLKEKRMAVRGQYLDRSVMRAFIEELFSIRDSQLDPLGGKIAARICLALEKTEDEVMVRELIDDETRLYADRTDKALETFLQRLQSA